MSLPQLLSPAAANDTLWRRQVAFLVNLVARRAIDQGATAERPNSPDVGSQFYDVTLGKPVWWNGTAWRDASGTAV